MTTPNDQPKIQESEGRICRGVLCCGKFHAWDLFDRKPDGLNGRNPICKKCISHQRKAKRKALRKKSKTPEMFLRVIVGRPGRDIELEVGEILGKGIVTLLEQGHLK